MARRSWKIWFGAALLLLMTVVGCNGLLSEGVLFEQQFEDGRSHRLRVEGLEGWQSWNHRYTNKNDEMGVIMKKEGTF